MASVVPDFFLPPNIFGVRRSSLTSLAMTTLSRTFARIYWSWIGLQLLASVFDSFLAFRIRIVSLVLQLAGIPSSRALLIVIRNSFSLDFLNSLTILVGIRSGPGDAPLGEALRAASSSSSVSSMSGVDSINMLSLCRGPPVKGILEFRSDVGVFAGYGVILPDHGWDGSFVAHRADASEVFGVCFLQKGSAVRLDFCLGYLFSVGPFHVEDPRVPVVLLLE